MLLLALLMGLFLFGLMLFPPWVVVGVIGLLCLVELLATFWPRK